MPGATWEAGAGGNSPVEDPKTPGELAYFCSMWGCQHGPMGTSLGLVPICPHP